jgi:dUTPase
MIGREEHPVLIRYLPRYDLDAWGELSFPSARHSGFDLRSAERGDIVLPVGGIGFVRTGIVVEEMPSAYEIQIRQQPDLLVDQSVVVMPGEVDAAHQGEVIVLLMNQGRKPFTVKRGVPVARGVFAWVPHLPLMRASAATPLPSSNP